MELRGAAGEDAEDEVIDTDDPTSEKTTNPKRMECDGAVVEDEELKGCSDVRGDECDKDNSSMGENEFERGSATTRRNWGHYDRGCLVTGSPFIVFLAPVLGEIDGATVMSYCAGSVSSPQKPVKPPGSGYEYSVILHGNILYRNLAFLLCSWASASLRVI